MAVRLPRASKDGNSTDYATIEDVRSSLRAERELLVRQLDHHVGSVQHPVRSCNDLPQGYLAGYYWAKNSTGGLSQVYCDTMSTFCGGGDGDKRWTRVAHLDMTDAHHSCPAGFEEKTSSSNKRMCAKLSSTPGCSSVSFSHGQEYTRVCGKIKAYQQSHPNGFNNYISRRHLITINDSYVDGVSLTCGVAPRQHIWTFAAAYSVEDIRWKCSCDASPDLSIVPPFVGGDFFCDTASRTGYEEMLFESDPLWDGEGCGPEERCCGYNKPPWFRKQLPESMSEDIEMRLCLNEHSDYGNVLIEALEIYVQ